MSMLLATATIVAISHSSDEEIKSRQQQFDTLICSGNRHGAISIRDGRVVMSAK